MAAGKAGSRTGERAQKPKTPKRKPSGKTPGKTTGRSRGKSSSPRLPAGVIFFLFLFIALVIIVFINLPKVSKMLKPPQKQVATEQLSAEETSSGKPDVSAAPPPGKSVSPVSQPSSSEKQPSQKPAAPQKPAPEKPADKSNTAVIQTPPAAPPAGTQTEGTHQQAPPTVTQPAPSHQDPSAAPPAAIKPPVTAEKPAQTVDRSIYLMQDKGSNAALVLTKVSRKLIVSDSPLSDSVNALLSGPSADEKKRDLVSFVPDQTKLLSAFIRGNTAYLDFNQAFRYNPLGREGCEAQLKQIIWTATEFSPVSDVQILIEGKVVEILSEGVLVGSPIGRQ